MSYLTSPNVRVYPAALRGGTDSSVRDTIYDPESRIGTEFNLTNPVNRLTINGSFVINNAHQSGWLEFSVHGYYFKAQVLEWDSAAQKWVPNARLNLSSATKLYGSIRLTQLTQSSASTTYQLISLSPWSGTQQILDDSDSGEFRGVYISDTIEGSEFQREGVYSLLLLQKSGDEWIVPATSCLRFDSSMVAVGQTPLSDILGETEGEITLTTDHAAIGDAIFDEATINTLHNTVLIGSKGQISNGVAEKAIAISDSNGTLRSTNSTHAIYLNGQGVPTEITGNISNGTTGNAATATLAAKSTALETARTIQTNLASTSAVEFNGTANITPGVTGTLQPTNGGTGKTALREVTVGWASGLGSSSTNIGGTTIETNYNRTTTLKLASGQPQIGLTIYSSKSAPDPNYSSLGQTGDIWFQYN